MLHSLIVAMARNRVIGRDNALPWRLPADLAHFKRITMGHPVIMGRRTFESIGKPLPGRANIVVSRSPGFMAPGCEVAPSLEAAWRAADGAEEAFVIGDAALYESALPSADRIYLTEVDAEVEGDTRFPPFDRSRFRETELGAHARDERHAHSVRFVILERLPRGN